MTSDEQLMAQVAAGDTDAFEEIVRRHQNHALNVAYHFLGNRDQAADVAQEAFLRVLAAAARYRPLATFRTYLHRIVWHLCVDVQRKKRPRTLESLPPAEDPTGGPEQAAIARERSALVRRAVRQLPARQRMALVLKHYENLSYQEIGRTLGCSSRAVDALLIRAKRKLKELLEGLI